MEKENDLTPEDIADCICALIARNKLWAGKNVNAYFIANKTAGCFTNNHKSAKYKKFFSDTLKAVRNDPECAASISYKIFSTEYSGHAADLTRSVVSQLIATDDGKGKLENLIITAGGDGTSLEVQTALYKCAMEGPKHLDAIMNKITILRLPLGTGNDGTDGHSIEETVELLKSGLTFANSRAVKVYPEKNLSDEEIQSSAKACGKNQKKYCDPDFKSPRYSFNIASIGVDAYVVYLTNTVKKKLPGNFYHLCVPLGGLLYDKDFPTGPVTIELFEKAEEKTSELKLDNGLTLMAFGASGYRVYGGGHKVLPNEKNLCIAPKVSLPVLIKHNNKFVDGSFEGTNLASLHSVEKIRISYKKAVLMQCDGETVMLTPAHFPLIMELTEPCLRMLAPQNF